MTAFEQAIEFIRETNPEKAELLEAINRAEAAEARAAELAELKEAAAKIAEQTAAKAGKGAPDWEAAVERWNHREEERANLGGKKI